MTAWNDLSGLDGTAAPETTELRSPTGSIVSDDDSARIVWSIGPADGVEFIGVHDGSIYVSTDTQIIAASLADGAVVWQLNVTQHVYAQGGPVIEVGDVTLVPADDGFVYAITTG